MGKLKISTNPKTNIHDQFVKAVFAHTELVAGLLRQYAEPTLLKQLDLRKIKLEPTHFVGEEGRERIADMIYSIPLKKGRGTTEVIFVFEHKSERRRSLGLQLLKYLTSSWNRIFSAAANRESDDFFLPAPLLIVLHNGPKPLIDKPTLEKMVAKVAGTERFIPKFEFDIIDLPALRVEDLGDAPLLRVILELLKRATDGTLNDVQTQILEPLAAIRDDAQTRYWIQRILQYMDNLQAQKYKRMTRKQVGQIIQPVYKERSDDMTKTLFEEIEETGYTRGVAIGEARGEARGEAKAVLTVLRTRFGKVPKGIESEVRKMTDPTALESWLVYATTCKSLDEFAKAIK